MYRKLPPLNSLKAFESAARYLSFTKAASELFVTQAAISHQIKLLEDSLGVKLFHRRNRVLELTEQGNQYFLDIQPLLHQLAAVTDKMRQQSGRQTLTISVPQTFGMYWLVPHLNEFHQLFPDIDVRIKGVDQDEGELGKEIDVAIYYGTGQWSENLESIQLTQSRLLVLASPKLLEKTPINTPQDLVGKHLLHVFTRNKWRQMIDYLQLSDLDADSGSLFSHTFMALQAAMHEQGIAIANQVLAQNEIELGNLVEPFKTDLYDSKAFYVVYPPQSQTLDKVQHFVHWIQDKMEQLQRR